MIRMPSTVVYLSPHHWIWCLLVSLLLHPFPIVRSFGVPKISAGEWQRGKGSFHFHEDLAIRIPSQNVLEKGMVLSSAVRMASQTMGRRSKRLMALPKPSVDGICSSSSAASDMGKTPSPVPITPSPRPKRRNPAKASPQKTPSPRKKRSRSSSSVEPVTPDPGPISRRLELGENTNAAEVSSGGMVENNDLELTADMVALVNPSQDFIDLKVSPTELRPSKTLTTGQCFHWRVVHPATTTTETEASASATPISAWGTHDATEWVGIVRLRLFNSYESVVLVVRELPETTLYRPLVTTRKKTDHKNGKNTTEEEERDELHRALREYFRLDVRISELYKEWSRACPRLSVIAKYIPGVRIISQDPWECLVSFICSSNNNIPRITKMLGSLRKEYGQPLLRIPAASTAHSESSNTREYIQLYTFPSPEELASQATDQDLRGKCGMGYRAGYIIETTKLLQETGGEDYLWTNLRDSIRDPTEVQARLCEFKGVGKKVADCVALFSLHQDDAIPVDTHVWNIAIRDYDPKNTLKTTVKSLTPTNYQKVGNLFRSRFPNRSGWAHSLLFVAELPSFRGLLPKDMVDEMDAFQKEEKERKKQQKKAKT